MEEIITGSSLGRTVRAAVLVLMITGFAAAFLYDAFIGYPRENARTLQQTLGRSSDPLPAIDPRLTSETAAERIKAISTGAMVSELRSAWGLPSLEHDGTLFYLGPAGYVQMKTAGQRVLEASWVDGLHSPVDLAMQRWIGYALLVALAVSLVHAGRVLLARVSFDERGLKLPGRSLIPLERIRGIRAGRYAETGCVSLEFEEQSRVRRVVLDPYFIRDVRRIVAAICARKRFADPTEPSSPTASPPERNQMTIDS